MHTTASGAFFTSEQYSTYSYVSEQLNDQLWKVSYDGNPPFYFGVSPSFIKSCMNEKFSEAVVIAMGCNSLQFDDRAQAFVEKGARAYVGWTGSVLASYTDLATKHLLHHLLLDKQTIKGAVTQTMEEVGFDPQYQSQLIYYPFEAGSYTIQNIVGNLVTGAIEIQQRVL